MTPHDLLGCLPYPVRERSGEVCLVEVAGSGDSVEDRNALPEKVRGVPRALDLANGATSQARRLQKVTLGRTHGPVLPSAKYSVNSGVSSDDALPGEPRDERLDILQ